MGTFRGCLANRRSTSCARPSARTRDGRRTRSWRTSHPQRHRSRCPSNNSLRLATLACSKMPLVPSRRPSSTIRLGRVASTRVNLCSPAGSLISRGLLRHSVRGVPARRKTASLLPVPAASAEREAWTTVRPRRRDCWAQPRLSLTGLAPPITLPPPSKNASCS